MWCFRWVAAYLMWKSAYRIHHSKIWDQHHSNSKWVMIYKIYFCCGCCILENINLLSLPRYLRREDLVLYPVFPEYSFRLSDSASTPPLVFTSNVNNVYGFKTHYINPVKTVYTEKANCDLSPVEQVFLGYYYFCNVLC